MNFIDAVSLIHSKRIRRTIWPLSWYITCNKYNPNSRLCYGDNSLFTPTVEEVLAEDWEIYESRT